MCRLFIIVTMYLCIMNCFVYQCANISLYHVYTSNLLVSIFFFNVLLKDMVMCLIYVMIDLHYLWYILTDRQKKFRPWKKIKCKKVKFKTLLTKKKGPASPDLLYNLNSKYTSKYFDISLNIRSKPLWTFCDFFFKFLNQLIHKYIINTQMHMYVNDNWIIGTECIVKFCETHLAKKINVMYTVLICKSIKWNQFHLLTICCANCDVHVPLCNVKALLTKQITPCTGSHAGFLLSHVRGFNFEAAKCVKN
jgi:hypothetical protein